MSSLRYTTSKPRKHNVSHSKFVAPSNNLFKDSKTHGLIPWTYDEEQQKKLETSAEAKFVRENLLRKRCLIAVGPLPPDRDEEFLPAYPFVEEPVRFDFGSDYGNHMFLDLEKELSFERHNYGRGLCADVFAAVDRDLSDDVLSFSSRDQLLLDQYFSAKSPRFLALPSTVFFESCW